MKISQLIYIYILPFYLAATEGKLEEGSTKTSASQEDIIDDDSLKDVPHTDLNTGRMFPLVGMGVGNLQHELIVEQITNGMADSMRYRLIDTAHASQNEQLVRQGVVEGLKKERGDSEGDKKAVHVVTKVWYTYLGYERTKIAVHQILQALDDPSLKIHLLLHWPRCRDDIPWMECEKEEDALPQNVKDAGPPPHLDKDNAFVESWKALEDIYTGKITLEGGGKIASIGVSNFELGDLETLKKVWTIPPAIYQGNIWALMFDPHLISFLKQTRIHFQAYNVMNGIFSNTNQVPNAFDSLRLMRDALEIRSEELGYPKAIFTPYMVALKWLIQQSVSIVPRTTKPDHLGFNSAVALMSLPPLEQHQMEKVHRAVGALLRGHDLEVPTASFHNPSKESHVHLFWAGHDGNEVPVAKVKPGESFHTNTFTGHKFVAYGDDKKKGRREFTIRAGFAEHEEIMVDEL